MARQHFARWLRCTGISAARGWVAFLRAWIPATLPIAAGRIWSGEGTGLSLQALWWIIPLLGSATYSGAFAYAASNRLEARRGGCYARRWALGSADGAAMQASPDAPHRAVPQSR